MSDFASVGRKGDRQITVEFTAPDEVLDSERLCGWLHDEIEGHLRSISELPIDGWKLHARIERCRMATHEGEVRVALDGTIDGRLIEEIIAVEDRPAPAGETFEEANDKATEVAIANLFTYLGRLLFPTELVRALGRRWTSGRLVRAWADCCSELRIRIDRAVERPNSGGGQMLRRNMRTAVLAGLFFTALSIVEKLLFDRQSADAFRGWLACGLIGIGVFGTIASSGLLMLPSRFFQAERQGLDLVRLFGVKSLAGIRFVACGLLSISLLFAVAPGIYWLFLS